MSTSNSLPSPQQTRRATLELVATSALWGFGFIATIWALADFTPLMITALRFTIAGLTGLLIAARSKSAWREINLRQFKVAFMPGFLIMLCMILQTWGLRYTTATKSGFITTTYVLMVPIIERVWLKRKLGRYHWLFVFLALIGLALICDLRTALDSSLDGLTAVDASRRRWNIGDLLTFFCAVAASIQIVWLTRIRNRISSSFDFNTLQSIWAAIVPVLLVLLLPTEQSHMTRWNLVLPWAGILWVSIGSTMIGFAIQVRAQRVISASLASLVFLLESPFTAVFAVAILGETLRYDQWFGGVLVLIAVALSIVLET